MLDNTGLVAGVVYWQFFGDNMYTEGHKDAETVLVR